MIYYRTDTWLEQIYKFNGTVWKEIWWKALILIAYTAIGYIWCIIRKGDLAVLPKNILGSLLSFLLVFRANSAYSRYWQARTLLTEFFCDLEEYAVLGLMFLPGGERNYLWRQRHATGKAQAKIEDFAQFTDQNDRIVSEERADLLRWVLISALSMHVHLLLCAGLEIGDLDPEARWLVDWCRYRIRCLTTAEEFLDLDKHIRALAIPQAAWEDALAGPLEAACAAYNDPDAASALSSMEVVSMPRIRLPSVVLYKLLRVIIRNANDARLQNKKFGVTERFLTVFMGLNNKMAKSVCIATQIITTPLPFPYYHLCRMLLFTYFLCFPLFIQISQGFWANVGEFALLAAALLGIDAIATELENPFGQDVNDLDIFEKISHLEQEIVFFAGVNGDLALQHQLVWKEMPDPIAERCVAPLTHYLALRSQTSTDGRSKDAFHGQRAEREVPESEGSVDDELSDDS